LDHKLATLIDGVDLNHDTHLAATALEKMLAVLARGGDSNELRTSQMLVRLARTFTVPVDSLRKQLEVRTRQTARRVAPAKIESKPEPAAKPTKPLEPITGIDRELFEIMIEYPEAAAQAIEAIDPDWLFSNTSRMLMRAYRDLELHGHELDLQSLMLAIDDERLKGLLVGLDQSIQQREGFATQPFDLRFGGLLERYRRLQSTVNSQRQLTQMETDVADIDSATQLLGDIIAAQRIQQGLKPK
jgi:hypothetical protein